MLYVFYDSSIYNYLWVLEFLLLLWLILIVVNKNPVICVLFLIAVFLTLAIYMIILNFSFIGISYLLIYVGAVSIIILFILMLIDVRNSELNRDTPNNLFLTIVLSGVFFYFLIFILTNKYSKYDLVPLTSCFEKIKSCLFNLWDGLLIDNFDIITLGNIFYNSTTICLIISLLSLLLAIVGYIKINVISSGHNRFFFS